jgi:hypothetical protein
VIRCIRDRECATGILGDANRHPESRRRACAVFISPQVGRTRQGGDDSRARDTADERVGHINYREQTSRCRRDPTWLIETSIFAGAIARASGTATPRQCGHSIGRRDFMHGVHRAVGDIEITRAIDRK